MGRLWDHQSSAKIASLSASSVRAFDLVALDDCGSETARPAPGKIAPVVRCGSAAGSILECLAPGSLGGGSSTSSAGTSALGEPAAGGDPASAAGSAAGAVGATGTAGPTGAAGARRASG